MLLIFLGFLFFTVMAFGIPFLMGGNDRARASSRGLIFATIAAFGYLVAVIVFRNAA